ncbi:MAG: DHH family phosphoesterase, partial [Paracoccaceae bacterium]
MTTLVFGHKAPDTDSTGSALIWAWYLSDVKGENAEARLLGVPNTEAAFVIERWGFETPEIIADVAAGDTCVIVDTNNAAELPPSINAANVTQIIDHHMLAGGLTTKTPIDITIRPVACTATIMY